MGKKNIDNVDMRKKKQLRRSLLRFLILVLIAAFCVFLYVERGSWLTGMENKIDSIRQNDGVLADGNFPLSISGNGDYQAEIMEDDLAILNNSYLYLYSDQGESLDTRQIAYTNAVMQSGGDRILCFENGGIGFRVDNTNGCVYEKEAENIIISGDISSSGYTALITESNTYSCSIYVYSQNGKKLYTRNCVERVNEICFNPDNSGCVFVQLDASDGEISSVLKCIEFDKEEIIWEAPALSTLCLEASYTSDGRICIIGDSVCAYYNKKGQMESMYTYSGSLISYDAENGQAAILVRSDETRETNLLLFDSSAESPMVIPVNNSASYVKLNGSTACLMSTDNVVAYSFEGKAVATVNLDFSYDRFLRQDEYLFLMSYDQIDRVNFNQ